MSISNLARFVCRDIHLPSSHHLPLSEIRLPLSHAARGANAKPTHFLLYLNFETFVGDHGAQLAEEVRKAMAAKLPFVMLHENDPDKDGCQFERCAIAIVSTPAVLDGFRWSILLVGMQKCCTS